MARFVFSRINSCAACGVSVRAARLLPFDLAPVVERTAYGVRFSLRQSRGFSRSFSDPLTFLTQRARQVGQHEQLVGSTALTERAAADLPAPQAAAERQIQRAGHLALEARSQAQLARGASHGPCLCLAQEPLARSVEQAQALVLVEREDGHVHFGDHPPQERRGFERAQPLAAQHIGQLVDLEQRQAQGFVGARAPRANGVVPFPQGGQEVGNGLEGTHHPLADGGRDGQPPAHGKQGHGPLHLGREVARPQQHQRYHDGRQAGEQPSPEHAALVGQGRLPRGFETVVLESTVERASA